MAQTCILQADVVLSFSGVVTYLFCFVSLPLSASFFVYYVFCFFVLRITYFPEYFCTISVLFLNGEYDVRFLLPGGAFLPCDHGLDFFFYGRIQSINQSKVMRHLPRIQYDMRASSRRESWCELRNEQMGKFPRAVRQCVFSSVQSFRLSVVSKNKLAIFHFMYYLHHAYYYGGRRFMTAWRNEKV